MPILEGDIQIMASQVLDDVPEGGGAATGTAIADGASNNLYPDVSELDRVYGRVQLRKVFPAVRTEDTDRYSGANVIVVDPPDDPAVSVVLFDTDDAFDTRTQAATRIEAYLSLGAAYGGLLFGNHIQGQMTVSVIQRAGTQTPAVGETIVLRKNEGLVTQIEQYVRVTEVSTEVHEFTDTDGDFERMVVTMGVSDQLVSDFPGFDAVRRDASVSYTGKTRVYDTLVADAARYYGVVSLKTAITLGAYTAQVDGIFSQLVPSSRTETPIADARMNQVSAAYAAAGGVISASGFYSLSATQTLFAGGGILPGTFVLVVSGTTYTDNAGQLMQAGTPIGTVDYENGIVAPSITISGNGTLSYRPAGRPGVVSESFDIPVTVANQRLTYTLTLNPVPLAASLQISYLSQGRWYVLNEDGSGAIRGADSSLGAGTINFTTGTISLTLGALPDILSSIILVWAPSAVTEALVLSDTALDHRFGQRVTLPMAIKPGTLSIAWNDGTARTATDSNGSLIGDAKGKVFYQTGVVIISPNSLPAVGTPFSVSTMRANVTQHDAMAFTDGGSAWTTTLTLPVRAGAVEMSVVASYDVRSYPGVDEPTKRLLRVTDDGAGALVVPNETGTLTIGSINYGTGDVSINKSTAGLRSVQGVWEPRTVLGTEVGVVYTGTETRTLPLAILNGPAGATLPLPAWAWWTGSQTGALKSRYSASDTTAASTPYTFTQLELSAPEDVAEALQRNVSTIKSESSGTTGGGSAGTGVRIYESYNGGWQSVKFLLGGHPHISKVYGAMQQLMIDPSAVTGEGPIVGSMPLYGRDMKLTSWPTGVSPQISSLTGVKSTPTEGLDSLSLVDRVTFRTATAPVAPNGFNVVGTLSNDATFNEVADEDGFINGGGVVGKIDYETGVVRLVFGAPTLTPGTGVIDVSALGVPGVTLVALNIARADTLRYNAVAYSYIPLAADILGLNPVRLPPDGRVPIFRPGTVAVVHHTADTSPVTVSNGQTISTGRIRLSRVQVIGANDLTISTGYAVNKIAGTVTFSDVSGYSQPVTIRHRIEDMALVSDAQISGLLRFTRPMSHAYPVGSYVSSALLIGDMKARVASVFDQNTWTNVWSDDLIGTPAPASYDLINHPPVIENLGAVTERWALVFTGATGFNIIGEHLGQVGTGTTTLGCAPLNPATGTPYFELAATGFGTGWVVGNALRINTVGAIAPVWVARVVQQSEPEVLSDSFTMAVRGDVDTP